jgi:hypothetical protein
MITVTPRRLDALGHQMSQNKNRSYPTTAKPISYLQNTMVGPAHLERTNGKLDAAMLGLTPNVFFDTRPDSKRIQRWADWATTHGRV